MTASLSGAASGERLTRYHHHIGFGRVDRFINQSINPS